MTATPLVGSGGSAGGEAFADAHRALLADRSIQFELEPAPSRPQAQGQPLDFTFLFWFAAAAGMLFLIYAIASSFDRFALPGRRRREKQEQEEAWRPEAEQALGLLGEADALAARGEFTEAAHLLLFRSIEEIESRRPDSVRPALTSRDIAGLPAIPPQPRLAFGRIVALVERGLFARRPLAAQDWSDCRSAYEAFAFSESWAR